MTSTPIGCSLLCVAVLGCTSNAAEEAKQVRETDVRDHTSMSTLELLQELRLLVADSTGPARPIVEVLVERGDSAVPAILESAKAQPTGSWQVAAVEALCLMRTAAAGDALLQLLTESPNPDVVRLAIWGLSEHPLQQDASSEQIDAVVRQMDREIARGQYGLAAQGAVVISRLTGDTRAIPAVIDRYGQMVTVDDVWRVASNETVASTIPTMLRAFRNFGQPAQPILRARREAAADPVVRKALMLASGYAGDHSVSDELVMILKTDSNLEIRCMALRALPAAMVDGAPAVLHRYVDDASPVYNGFEKGSVQMLRRCARDALGELGLGSTAPR